MFFQSKEKMTDTIIDKLKSRAETSPNGLAYSFIDKDLNSTGITYSQLLDQVHQYALQLVKHQINYGDRCLLLFPQGLDFIISFLGCSWVGAIPIPLNMPGRNKPLTKWEKIVTDCDAKAILTNIPNFDFLSKCISQSSILSSISLFSFLPQEKNNISVPDNAINELAFLQYTSGSTGNPKGVMVTQSSLANNLKEVKLFLDIKEESVIISWLPFYHDMGLIFGILQGLFSGCKVYLISPTDFMSQPFIWAKAISQYKGTHISAPNFAYELIAEKLEKTATKDISLSTLVRAVCGAEPIHLSTMYRFYTIASKFGMGSTTLSPSYGLAESTLAISSTFIGNKVNWIEVERKELLNNKVTIINQGVLQDSTAPIDKKEDHTSFLISNGTIINDNQVTIINPNNNTVLPPYEIGEICFSGPSVTKGYWNNPEATKKAFVTDHSISTTPYLKTGDLGFLDTHNELYVTGRIKDLIIINGVNYYPHDIERSAFTSNQNFRTDGAAAFAISKEGQEKVVLIQELTREAVRNPQYDLWVQQIKEEIIRTHGILLEVILFIPPMHIPRTTSGKIQRSKSKATYLNKEWRKILYSYTRTYREHHIDDIHNEEQINEYLTLLVADQLGVSKTGFDRNIPFVELGITSMMSLLIRDTLENTLQQSIPATVLFNYNTIDQLSNYLANLKTETKNTNKVVEIENSTPQESDYDTYSEDDLLTLLDKELND